MSDLDPAAVEAAGRAICRDGWDVAAERAVHIGSVRAALTAAAPFIARATADAIADKIETRLKDWPEDFPEHRVIRDCARFARSFPTAVAE